MLLPHACLLLLLATTNAALVLPTLRAPGAACLRRGAPRVCMLSASPAGSKALLKAARDGDVDALESLLADSTDLSSVGSMALHVASGMGHASFVRGLLDAGVSPTAVEKGVTALHSAAFKNRLAVVETLLAAGADPDAAQERDGSTALLEAAVAGHAAVVKALLAAGADPDKGLSAKPLPSAAIKNRVEVLKLLLEAGADPNGAETDGSTALLKAVAMRHTQP